MIKQIKTTQEAIKLLTEERGFDVSDVSMYKWKVGDEDFTELLKTDEQLINFANDQAQEVEEWTEDLK